MIFQYFNTWKLRFSHLTHIVHFKIFDRDCDVRIFSSSWERNNSKYSYTLFSMNWFRWHLQKNKYLIIFDFFFSDPIISCQQEVLKRLFFSVSTVSLIVLIFTITVYAIFNIKPWLFRRTPGVGLRSFSGFGLSFYSNPIHSSCKHFNQHSLYGREKTLLLIRPHTLIILLLYSIRSNERWIILNYLHPVFFFFFPFLSIVSLMHTPSAIVRLAADYNRHILRAQLLCQSISHWSRFVRVDRVFFILFFHKLSLLEHLRDLRDHMQTIL